jgi:hypothetical protein
MGPNGGSVALGSEVETKANATARKRTQNYYYYLALCVYLLMDAQERGGGNK